MMKTPEQEKERLLGYLLNALDDREAAQVKEELACEPRLCAELAALQRELSPLNYLADSVEPPPRLAKRTCANIWATLDKEDDETNEKLDCPPTQDSVLGFIHDPFKTAVAMPVVEPTLPTVTKIVNTAPKHPPKSSHHLGLIISVSIGVVVAIFVFPMIRYAERSTRSYITDNWTSEINRRVDQYEQIYGNQSKVPRIEEMIPLNLALYGWQELPLRNSPSSFAPSFIQAEGEPYLSNEVSRGQQPTLLPGLTGWNEPVPLEVSGLSNPILLSFPGRESSIRSAFGQDVFIRDGRVFFRTLPGAESPKKTDR